MRILCCGDVIGRSGRMAIEKYIPQLREALSLDFVMVNGENAAHGFGLTEEICKDFFSWGVDVITSGNHIWRQRSIFPYLNGNVPVIRPANYPKTSPGKGVCVVEVGGKTIVTINLMGQVFMEPVGDPCVVLESILASYVLGVNSHAIVVDFHGEATAEKASMANAFDGRVSVFVGSHTHIPTADNRVLPLGTAFQTDMGMTGDYNSVIGMDKSEPIKRLRQRFSTASFSPATGEATLCGVVIDLDNKTGLALSTQRIHYGGILGE